MAGLNNRTPAYGIIDIGKIGQALARNAIKVAHATT